MMTKMTDVDVWVVRVHVTVLLYMNGERLKRSEVLKRPLNMNGGKQVGCARKVADAGTICGGVGEW